MSRISVPFRRKLLSLRNEARRDPRLLARFKCYRLNIPSQDESAYLLSAEDWADTTARPVPDPDGKPVVGLDLGAGRSWSAAVALWRNGRTEALAVCPGIPSISDQERRDRVTRGTYQRLVDSGKLTVAAGLKAGMDLDRAARLTGLDDGD